MLSVDPAFFRAGQVRAVGGKGTRSEASGGTLYLRERIWAKLSGIKRVAYAYRLRLGIDNFNATTPPILSR